MELRQRIRNFLESFDFYFRIRFSDFFLKYIQKKHFSVAPTLQLEKEYYLSFLKNIKGDKKIIFDVGANEGFISYFFLEENFKVIAIEPDARNQKILTARFNNQKGFKLIGKGASDKEKIAPFFVHNRNSALNTFSRKWKESIESKSRGDEFLGVQDFIELTTLDQIIKKEGVPSFIKIDVEGHELEVVKGLNTKIPLLSFEANFPDFKEETFLILEKLVKIDEKCKFNYSINFQLELTDFVEENDIKEELLKLNGIVCLEIFCKMSNYSNFYD
jgi:FkbM family methyltransferase